jgi:hypothetical protein
MEVRHCIKCGKDLSPNTMVEMCGLCAIGLTPSDPLSDFAEMEADPQVDSRVLSGSYCPYCHAEMTITDLSRRSCSICGALVVPEALRVPMGPITAQRPQQRVGASEPMWPDDAPLW